MKQKILIFGTFDIIHPGHENFFEQARLLSQKPELIVSVALDINVKKIKGSLPRHSQDVRLSNLQEHKLIDRALLGSLDDYISHIAQISPDIIALGYDQVAYTDKLAQKLKSVNQTPQIYKLKPFEPDKYKTSKIIFS